MAEERDDIVVLTDEDGNEHEFEVVDYFEVDGKEYAILLPAEGAEEEEEEALIFRVEEDTDGNQVLVEIEDDDEWEKVASAWEEMAEHEGEDEDDEE